MGEQGPGLGGGRRERRPERGLAWKEATGATERGGGVGRSGRSGGLAWGEAAGRVGWSRGLSYRMHAAVAPPGLLSGDPDTDSGTHHTAQHSWQVGHPSLQKDSDPC